MKLIVHPLPQTVCRWFKRQTHFLILFRSMRFHQACGLIQDTSWVARKPWSFFRVPLGAWIRIHYFPTLYFTVMDQSVMWTNFWSRNFKYIKIFTILPRYINSKSEETIQYLNLGINQNKIHKSTSRKSTRAVLTVVKDVVCSEDNIIISRFNTFT
jgi:hypothetical protein